MRVTSTLYRLWITLALLGMVGAGCNGERQPTVHYLYLLDNINGPNAVEALRHDLRTGQITRLGRYSTGGQGFSGLGGHQAQAVVTNGNYVYAVNTGDSTVSAFRIQTDGSLALIGAPQPTGGPRPVSLTVSRDLLYVANAGHATNEPAVAGSYRGFRIRSDGAIVPLNCPIAPGPAPVEFTPGVSGAVIASLSLNANANVLVVGALLPNVVESYRLTAEGCLTDRKAVSDTGGPFSVTFRPDFPDQALITFALPQFYPGQLSPGLATFSVDSAANMTRRGFYTDPLGADNTGLRDPCWVVIGPDGRRVWTSSFIPRSINLFNVDAAGNVTRRSEYQPSDTIPDPDNPGTSAIRASADIAINRQGTLVYWLRGYVSPDFRFQTRPSVMVFDTTQDETQNAGLRLRSEFPLETDLTAAGVSGLALVER